MTDEEVLAIIEKAKKKKATTLDLSNKKLKSLPVEIGQLSQLQELELSGNQLTELPAEIGQLSHLKELYLWGNQLAEVPTVIGQLSQLKELYLSENQLTELPAEIGQLSQLQKLNLSGNQLTELPTEIGQLSQLQKLDLSKNQLTELPAEIGQLSQLQELILYQNQLTELPAEIGQLSQLKVLILYQNQLTELPAATGQLSQLKKFVLWGNQLTELPTEIGQLSQLKELNLSGNQLTELPTVIGQLLQLIELYLSGNQLTELPAAIVQLSHLKVLILYQNQLTELPAWSGQLSHLQKLNLSGNQLTEVPAGIGQLSQLQELNLSGNQLTELPTEIGQLSQLQELNLSKNQLTELPAEIGQLSYLKVLILYQNPLTELLAWSGQLSHLQKLDLSEDQLTVLPAEIGQLLQLQELNLSGNQLTELPTEIGQLSQLQKLNLADNPLEKPPIDIAVQGIEAIRNYFQSLVKQGEEFVYEAKLILVGEPGAGKTSLAQKILNPGYTLNPTEPMTKGIDIEEWYFPFNDKITFRTNIWDFGGQEIMHATHRYFLTQRSLYIILADNRKEDTDFYYWLRMVELFSGGSPVLVVLNEKHEYKKFVPQDLIESFECIKDVFNINLADNKGLDDLINATQKYAKELLHVGKEPIPKKWVEIRKILEHMNKNHISLEDYLEICKTHGIKEEQKALYISGFLHDLGIILHFQKDPLLKNCLVLNPHWATEAVYFILLDPDVISRCGEFDYAEIEQIWDQPEYKFNHAALLRLMINFELCYEIGNTQKYIIPELLHEKPPVDGYPVEFKKSGIVSFLDFEYRYNFMPKGIISWLIVKMNRYIFKQLQWKNGVVLHYQDTYAEVIEQKHNRKLKIRIFGNEKNIFLHIIRKNIDEIHDSFKQLDCDEMVPCYCDECKKKTDPYFYKYTFLKNCEKKNIKTALCETGLEYVTVSELLKGVEIAEKDKTDEWKVFISYSSKDFDIIQKIVADCKENNIRYWLDDEQIEPGDYIIPQIENGLDKSEVILPCFSKNQLTSGWSRYEYEAVLVDLMGKKKGGKRIIPLIVDDLNDDELPRLVKGIRHVKLSEEREYGKMIDLLKKRK